MKRLALTGLTALLCFAKTIDTDLDGVPDNIDLCPNTPFLQTVNVYGCSKEQLKKKDRIYFYANIGYEKDAYKNYKNSSEIFASLSARKHDYKAKLYFSVKNDGYSGSYKTNDLVFSGYYYFNKLINKDSTLKIGAKIYFPTYFNDKTDFALYVNGSYFYRSISFSFSAQHKIYGEKDAKSKDTITASIGKYYKSLFISPYAYIENSPYNTDEWNKYLGITMIYPLAEKFDFSIDWSFDLQESQNYSLLGSLGYSF